MHKLPFSFMALPTAVIKITLFLHDGHVCLSSWSTSFSKGKVFISCSSQSPQSLARCLAQSGLFLSICFMNKFLNLEVPQSCPGQPAQAAGTLEGGDSGLLLSP